MGTDTQMLPVTLLPHGRPTLVVGGGKVAARKVASLLGAGAVVQVVSPELNADLERLKQVGQINHLRREYESGDTHGKWLVIAATDNPDVNKRIIADCHEQNILCSAVDSSWRQGDFIMPAVARSDGVTIAVSTAGKSPLRARELAHSLAERIGNV